MALTQRSLPLDHFYRETSGAPHLSQNLRSVELFTPLQLDRVTVAPHRYEVVPKALAPWGRQREYGGIQKVQLPVEFVKPKGFPPEVVQKGHRHYGDGSRDGRDLPVPQYYDLTNLHRSDVRTNDQLLPPAPHADMNKEQIDLPFPSEHPYLSHVSRLAVFPNFKTPDDPITGDPSRASQPLGTGNPASPYKVVLHSKTKGAPFRRELQQNPKESEKEPLEWSGEGDHYQLMKSPRGGQQAYYPTPPKIVHPNLRMRNEDQRIELRTANTLRNVEREQWKTTYDYQFTGSGPSNVMHLDDYHKKMVDEIKSGEEHRNTELVPATTPAFLPARPVEGRYGRLYQNRRPITADIRYPDADPAPDVPDVQDSRSYTSYPAVQPRLRRKDEWHNTSDTAEHSAEAKMATSNDPDVNEQWKLKQLESHPEHGLHIISNKKAAEKNADQGLEALPKTVEELVTLPEPKKYYLKDYQDERNDKFKKIEARHSEGRLKSLYHPKSDMQALRHKVDQVGTRIEPKALDSHSLQVAADQLKLEHVQRPPTRPTDRFVTGLKFTTEKITDQGPVTDLHDRQLDGYKTAPKTWRKDIPMVDPARQNHAGSLAEMTTKGNAFSLSTDINNKSFNSSTSSSTGSILRTPGSPPRTGAGRSITFNEVVKVASSEYGSEFKINISPLSKEESTRAMARPGTPTAMLRPVREPCAYLGLSPRGPALRPSSAYPSTNNRPPSQDYWKWNYDFRMNAQFDPLKWKPKPGTAPPQTSLLSLQNGWNKASTYKQFHDDFPENAPDMRDNVRHYELADKSADLRFNHSIKHREKRHKFYGFNSYHFHNGNPIV